MQRSLLIIIFSLCIFANTSVSGVSAQEASVPLSPTPTPIGYDLPYPGLLPDHPLYFLKVFRDTITSIFMGKPLDKAAYALLQSDKNVSASYLLIKQKKDVVLAQETFSSAQNYFEEAIRQTNAAKKQGTHTKELVNKLKLSNKKHKEVLIEIEGRLKPEERKKFQKERSRIEKLAKMAKTL